MSRPIGISAGDPCGIGPEIIAKCLSQFSQPDRFVVYGPAGELRRWGLPDSVMVKNVDEQGPFEPGQPGARAARAQLHAFEAGLDDLIRGELAAIVTAPWTKSILTEIGHPAVGHTEVIARRFPAHKEVMMLAGDRLRVSLVTTHIPISSVSECLSVQRIIQTITVTASGLRDYFGITEPKIAVLGLNPHAGESGTMGDEEQRLIVPAIQACKELGIECSGPYSADTFFRRFLTDAPFDAVVAMYHDQGLIPLKLLHFTESMNITLGLPVLRTSVDHGSAHDIAGEGIADPSSMKFVLQRTLDMVNRLEFA